MSTRPATRAFPLTHAAPQSSLLPTLSACHDHIYANDGLPKDTIFRDITRLLLAKILDERRRAPEPLFHISPSEYAAATDECPGTLHQAWQDRIAAILEPVYAELPHLERRPLQLRPSSVAYVVSRLQHHSLSDMPEDLKGAAYQTFFSRHHRGPRGEFFTPPSVVDLAITAHPPCSGATVLDPACGSGGFLVALRRQCGEDFNFIGVDINPHLVEIATLNLVLHGATRATVLALNALLPFSASRAGSDGILTPESADYIYTNPPFGTRGKVEDQSILSEYALGSPAPTPEVRQRSLLSATRGAQTPEILFIERCIHLVKPGGQICIVLPVGIAANSSLAYVREFVTRTSHVVAVYSLPDKVFGSVGTNPRSILLVLTKRGGRRAFSTTRLCKISDLSPRDSDHISTSENPANLELPAMEIAEIPSISGDSRFDPPYHLASVQRPHAENIGARTLGDVVGLVKERPLPEAFHAAAGFSYVDISSIDTEFGTIRARRVMAHEAPSRARQQAHTDDILVSLVRPDRGAIAVVPKELDGCVVSTGFAVLRTRTIPAHYLWAILKTPQVLEQMGAVCTASMYPALREQDLLRITLPPLGNREAQQRLAQRVSIAQRAWVECRTVVTEAIHSVEAGPERHDSWQLPDVREAGEPDSLLRNRRILGDVVG